MNKDLIIEKQKKLNDLYDERHGMIPLKVRYRSMTNDLANRIIKCESELSVLESQQPVETKEGNTAEEIDKFHHILLKHGIENRVFFTSNEFHTIWNAIQEYSRSQAKEPTVTDEIKDIIDCIVKYDESDSAKNKARYFDIIQRDFKKALTSDKEMTVKEAMQELDECIKKATPELSKIKDVDKTLDEIRGTAMPAKEQEEGGCTCQKCGKKYKMDVNIPDSIWNKIHGTLNLLCGNCIINLIENKIEYSVLFLSSDQGEKEEQEEDYRKNGRAT